MAKGGRPHDVSQTPEHPTHDTHRATITMAPGIFLCCTNLSSAGCSRPSSSELTFTSCLFAGDIVMFDL